MSLAEPPRNPRGSNKLTAKLIKAFGASLKRGNYFGETSEAQGIPRSTAYSWLERGRKAADLEEKGEQVPAVELKFLEFLDTITHASAKAEIDLVGIIAKGAKDDPRLALEFLKRRYPDRWGDRQKEGGECAENVNINQLVIGIVNRVASRMALPGESELAEFKDMTEDPDVADALRDAAAIDDELGED